MENRLAGLFPVDWMTRFVQHPKAELKLISSVSSLPAH